MASVGARPGLGDAPAPPVVGGEWEAGVTRRPKLTQNARLLGLAVIVGAFGALGAQVFLWMLGLTEKYLLTWFTGWQLPTPDQVAGGGAIPSVHFLGWHLPLILVLGGLVSGALVYFFAPEAEGHGDDAAIKSYHQEGGRMRARVPVVKTIASAITIGSGGSAGREGPSAQIAAGFASVLGSLLKLSDDDRRYLVLMGMAAGLSAIFKSPLGTAIFAVEILYGSLAFEGTALGFTIVASAVAYGVTGAISGWAPLFHLPPHLAFDHASHLVAYAGLGLVAGLLASVAPTVFYGMRDLFHKIPIAPHFKPAIGGLLLGIPAMWLPQVLSGGYGWMQLAIDGRLPMMLMLGLAFAKLISLALTMGSGGSGGVFAPTLYVGAMLGGGLAALSHTVIGTSIPPQAFAVVGMAAVFAGAARVPLASLIMVAELTGSYGLVVPTMVAVVISVVVQQRLTRNARYQSLYESQVDSPADSPVHHREYYRATLSLLRQHRFHLEDDVIVHELADRLGSGDAVPLPGTDRYLYAFRVGARSPAARQPVRSLGLPDDAVLVSVLRDRTTLAGHGDTIIESGDRVVVAARAASLEALRERFGDPTAGKGEVTGGDETRPEAAPEGTGGEAATPAPKR